MILNAVKGLSPPEEHPMAAPSAEATLVTAEGL